MAGLPGKLPYGLSRPAGSGGLYTATGFGYSYAVGGLPFLSSAGRHYMSGVNRPMTRTTAPSRKQQIDTQQTPGEQSLDGWWIRSQQSFHAGAGQMYGDPDSSDSSYSGSRFWRSKGINPWTPGQVSLLPRVNSLAAVSVRTTHSDGNIACGLLTSTDVYFVSAAGAYTTETPAVAGTPKSIVTNGSHYYLATTTNVYRRAVSAVLGSAWTAIYNNGATFASVILGWVKERLVLSSETGVYELTALTGPAVSLPAANWTPPQGTWTPACVTEGNSAIYVAGSVVGGRSIILKFTITTAGAMPVLASGVVVANLPQGEVINHITGYLGRFVAISTNLGPRIAIVDTVGDLEVGPVLFAGATGHWVARGQYLYTPAVLPEWGAGEGGLARVDIGTELSPLRFAYASDIFATTAGSGATSVGLCAAGLVLGTAAGLYLEDTTHFVDSGWLQGPRMRLGTLEPKVYKLLRARSATLTSDMALSVVDPNGIEYPVVGYVSGQTPGKNDVVLPSLGPQDFVSVKVTLFSTVDKLTSAVGGGYQLKALPAQPRQRLLVLPLLCFDWEKDRWGNVAGGEGTAMSRLMDLEALDGLADTVTLQDLDSDTTTTCIIEEVAFTQLVPPEGSSGWGGTIDLTLRTV